MDNDKRAQKVKIFDEIILKYSRKKISIFDAYSKIIIESEKISFFLLWLKVSIHIFWKHDSVDVGLT